MRHYKCTNDRRHPIYDQLILTWKSYCIPFHLLTMSISHVTGQNCVSMKHAQYESITQFFSIASTSSDWSRNVADLNFLIVSAPISKYREELPTCKSCNSSSRVHSTLRQLRSKNRTYTRILFRRGLSLIFGIQPIIEAFVYSTIPETKKAYLLAVQGRGGNECRPTQWLKFHKLV